MNPLPAPLRTRVREPERMDDPALPAHLHGAALEGLTRINRMSASAGAFWRPLRSLARTDRPLRVLDLACGAGDVALGLWRRARRDGVPVEVAGADRSPTAVDHARRSAARAGADVRFFPLDALADELPADYDVLACSLFLHHLDEPDAVRLLDRMGRHARAAVLVQDLRRSLGGLVLARVGARLLTRSPIVHVDAPLSVRAAFTVAELAELAARAGLADAGVRRIWPCRMQLEWFRP